MNLVCISGSHHVSKFYPLQWQGNDKRRMHRERGNCLMHLDLAVWIIMFFTNFFQVNNGLIPLNMFLIISHAWWDHNMLYKMIGLKQETISPFETGNNFSISFMSENPSLS